MGIFTLLIFYDPVKETRPAAGEARQTPAKPG
jgi:hypothetical protein